ncbi:insulinase family protein [Actinoplanes sp. TBRC 11911]|uniref:insulinase family protein n=1 Tax=Actinoplanes sp. TBRC 11911 TaxID=2729386 RepID=UPI001B7D5C06|nr:insulinase family protein [Actinoplanes sp. TBRC 11911]
MIERIDVDGVPALLAPGSGQTRAGLAFRVGFVDEPLARRGITHLVEHLAPYSAGVADYHYNGATGVEFTLFDMHGSDEDVASFLSGVCSSLLELPMHRLAIEKDLLRAEANGRGARIADDLPMWRHGARDYGMPGYPEWGLAAVTEDELHEWVARYFTKENAVLWVAGDHVPEGLKLMLPNGERRALPTPSSALPETPAWFTGPSGVLVWDALVPRGAAAPVFADVLERAMRREMRQESGLSYTVTTDYDTLGAERAVVTAVADALPEKQGELVGAFTGVLDAMCAGRIHETDLAAVVKQRVEGLEEAARRGATVSGQALNLLVGAPVRDVAEMIDEVRAVTVAEVADVAAAAVASGLLRTPGTRADWAGYAAAPGFSDHTVDGTSYAALAEPRDHLIIGADGVSRTSSDTTATVRFDACSIVLAWPDGGRQLVGHDAMVVTVEPTLYADGRAAVTRLDEHIPAGLRVDLPARDPDGIPQPPAVAVRERRAPRDRVGAVVGLIVLIPLALLCAMAAFGLLLFITEGEDPVYNGVLMAIFAAGLVVCGFAIHRCARRVYGR